MRDTPIKRVANVLEDIEAAAAEVYGCPRTTALQLVSNFSQKELLGCAMGGVDSHRRGSWRRSGAGGALESAGHGGAHGEKQWSGRGVGCNVENLFF